VGAVELSSEGLAALWGRHPGVKIPNPKGQLSNNGNLA